MRRQALKDASVDRLSEDQLDAAFVHFDKYFDSRNGGFGGAPKFPPAMSLEFLLRYHKRTGNARALEIVRQTCRKMAEGGIYDQLGGGFHRYSVDAVWLVPHFEKMLYDNAQLASVYLHLYQVTNDELFKRIAVETLDYAVREMTDPKGGFYSAQDADSEGSEGEFFIWDAAEIDEILGASDGKVFREFYGVTASGNFEGRNILNVANDGFEDVSDEVRTILDRGRKSLFEVREKRVKPFRDEKILTAWNGLMLSAFAEAAAVLGRDDYLQIARSNADFLISELIADGRVLRTWKDGRAKIGAFLEDYANLGCGLLDVFQTTGEIAYFQSAKSVADEMIVKFWDEESGGFFFTSADHEELIVRTKDFFDNATPSGNSAAADLLLKLAVLTGDDRYQRFAVAVLRLVAAQSRMYPSGFGRALGALEFYLGRRNEIVIVGGSDDLRSAVWRPYQPIKVVVEISTGDDTVAQHIPFVSGKTAMDRPAVFVCQDYTCRQPVFDVGELNEQMR